MPIDLIFLAVIFVVVVLLYPVLQNAFLSNLFINSVIILALLLNSFGITDIGTAVVFVVLVGIGFVFCQTVNLDRGFKRPLSFTILNAGLFLAAFITHAIVLVLWN